MKGRLIAVEGADGAGKTTSLEYVRHWAKKSHRHFVFTKEPAGTKLGQKIRKIIIDPSNHISKRTQAYLFAAARRGHVENVIAPELAKGSIVICDRYLLSSFAYQGDYYLPHSIHNVLVRIHCAKHLQYHDRTHVSMINRPAITYKHHVYTPDLNIYFSLDFRDELKRLNKRQHSKFDKFDAKVKHQKGLRALKKNYNIAIEQSGTPCLRINAKKKPMDRARMMWHGIQKSLKTEQSVNADDVK